MGTFQQDVCPTLERAVQHVDGVIKVAKQSLCVFVILRNHRIDVYQRLTERGKQHVFLCRTFFDHHTEPLAIAHLAGSHTDAFDFVGIRRPDALQGRAEFGITAQGLAHRIVALMPRENQVRQR